MCDRGGSTGDLSAHRDFGLVLKIMQTVERHNRNEHIFTDPLSLRDTMLAVAALLHMEALKMDGRDHLAAVAEVEELCETFAGAARCQLDAVVEAATILRHCHSPGYQ